MDVIYWDHYYNKYILVNLLIVVGVFISLKWCAGMITHVKSFDELSRKDNPAFGISLAGAMVAITIMLGGAVYGSPENNLIHSLLAVAGLGVLGIGMMAVTRFIFDKFILSNLSLRDEIIGGNKAVAIADAANALAAGIIIYTVMIWVPTYTVEAFMTLIGGYIISQILLTGLTVLRMKLIKKANQEHCLQAQLGKGNIAVALRFGGQKIGAALAMATAAHMVAYDEYSTLSILGGWLLGSVIVLVAWEVFVILAQKAILFKIDLDDEVINQENSAVGVMQAAIFIAVAMLISQL